MVVTLAHPSMAQMEKGLWAIRGNMGIELGTHNSSYENYPSQNPPYSTHLIQTYNVSPGIGYMVSDVWMLGVEGSFMWQRNDSHFFYNEYNEQWYEGNYRTRGIGVFARRFFDLNKKVQFFAESGVGIGGYSDVRDGSTTDEGPKVFESHRSIDADLVGGIHFRILPKLSLELSLPVLRYSAIERKSIHNDAGELLPVSSSRNFMFQFGSSLGLGFNFLF